jgi:virginiamycin B lyase
MKHIILSLALVLGLWISQTDTFGNPRTSGQQQLKKKLTETIKNSRPTAYKITNNNAPTVSIYEFPTGGAYGGENGAITGGPNNSASDTESNRIGSMTYPGGYSYIQTNPNGAIPYGIVQDGANLWVLQSVNGQNFLARYGQGSNYYPLSGTPMEITADSAGNLWYTQQNPGAVVEIDPNNPTIQVAYPIPGSGVAPKGITVGGDGGIWFTAYAASGNIVGRFDPKSHVYQTFALPNNYAANEITATGFGVGFTMEDGQSNAYIGVLKYDMSVFRHQAVPSATRGMGGIAYGPDGNLWFTEWGSNGMIGWASSVTAQVWGELPTPVSAIGDSLPRAITRGWFQLGNFQYPANTLWFTDEQGYIGRIDFPQPYVSPTLPPFGASGRSRRPPGPRPARTRPASP